MLVDPNCDRESLLSAVRLILDLVPCRAGERLPLLLLFRLLCVEGFTQTDAARRAGVSRGLVALRTRELESLLGVPFTDFKRSATPRDLWDSGLIARVTEGNACGGEE